MVLRSAEFLYLVPKAVFVVLDFIVVSYGVGFPNPTPNAIKSQINKRNIIVYWILLLFF